LSVTALPGLRESSLPMLCDLAPDSPLPVHPAFALPSLPLPASADSSTPPVAIPGKCHGSAITLTQSVKDPLAQAVLDASHVQIADPNAAPHVLVPAIQDLEQVQALCVAAELHTHFI